MRTAWRWKRGIEQSQEKGLLRDAPKVSATIMTPSAYFNANTDAPVTIGELHSEEGEIGSPFEFVANPRARYSRRRLERLCRTRR
jgi:hypothetical protein